MHDTTLGMIEMFEHHRTDNNDYLRSVFDEFRSYLTLTGLPEPNKEMTGLFEIDEHIRSCYKSFLPYFGKTKPLPETVLENKFKE